MHGLRLILVGVVLAASACFGDTGLGPVDLDGDGHLAADDCDDGDPDVWWPSAAFRDSDGDGHGAGATQQICSGTFPPSGWSLVSDDCDDANPVAWTPIYGYLDEDRDGVGAGVLLFEHCAAELPVGYSHQSGDCEPADPELWRQLAYWYRDADGDGATVPRDGLVCTAGALPPGYSIIPGVRGPEDCDDEDADVWRAMHGYADTDGDGIGAGLAVPLCTSGALPSGWALSAGDCAPSDRERWRMAPYVALDEDADGFTVAASGSVCSGAALPRPYEELARGSDCDDADRDAWQILAGYADADGDQVGAGALLSFCTGDTLPGGHVATGGDCDPADRYAWRFWSYTHRDADDDGRTVPLAGTLCIGTTPPAGYATAASGNDCDDADDSVWATVYGYADVDEDGVGAGEPLASCTDGSLPAGQVATSTDCAPGDRTSWRMLSHAWADRDGDGYTVPDAGQVCAGESLPEPYRVAAVGRDCDDAAPSVFSALVRYPDLDGDGVGAPPRAVFCVGASVEPAGHSRYGWDIDDADPSVQWDDDADDLLLLVL